MLATYTTVSLLVICVSIWYYKTVVNPLVAYASVWLLVILLYQLRLTPLQDVLAEETYVVFLVALLSYAAGCVLFERVTTRLACHHRNSRQTSSDIRSHPIADEVCSKELLIKLLIAWGVIEVIEIAYSGGIPLFWYLFSTGKTYFDFGISTVHGLMNALGLVIILLSGYRALRSKQDRLQCVGLVTGMLLYYCLLVTRQVIITAAIELIVVALILKPKTTVKVLLPILLLGIIGFGIIGNIRSGYREFLDVALIDSNVPPLLIGFYWVYMYLTMTVANINNLVLSALPAGGMGEILQFLPSIMRSIIPIEATDPSMYLVTMAFNVSGYFVDFYLAWKLPGVVSIAAIYGAIGGITFGLVRHSKSERNILLYAVAIQIVVLSFFYNHLLYLPVGFQFILIVVIWIINSKYCSSNKNIKSPLEDEGRAYTLDE